ncbi:NAD(P)H-binding protein [Novosphingobium decolorationis]|uniref:NAD(P)H-binding protein n=1 Tax=Novosphingobium decolorationis TaxID=2698673 RepID=A0ABX8E3P9_9SPHN|nr:NAD(P)H-binding protein [Novosphingobium decolorationis]QVM82856.1 NAD(P)H-binding protein [Novosphingobium decolorationis]
MSDTGGAAGPVRRICLVGASGLVGQAVLAEAVGREDVRIIAVARSEVSLPEGARMDVLTGPLESWPDLIAAARADVLVCALGTTIARAGSQDAFRAVDRDLVVDCAEAARSAGIDHMIVVSSVGAERGSRNFYLSVKGEMEEALGKLGFRRLDILRPGLLRGHRREQRRLEGLGQVLAPLADGLVLHGRWRRFRSVRARDLAQVIVSVAKEKAQGRFVAEHDNFRRVLQKIPA